MSFVLCFHQCFTVLEDMTIRHKLRFSCVNVFFFFQLSQFLENLSLKMSNAGDLDGILLTGT